MMINVVSGICAAALAFPPPTRQVDAKKDAPPNVAPQTPAKKDDKAPAVETGKAIWENIPECQEAQKKFREGNLSESRKLLDLAAAKHPDLPPSQVMFAVLFISSNQPQPGRQLLERAAIERPDHPEVPTHFGEIALAENRLSDAQVQFDRATQLAGNERWSLKQRQTFLSHAYAGLTAVAERRQDWDAAYANLYLLSKLDPENTRVQWRLGRAQFFKGKPEEALTLFQQAFAKDKALEPAELTMGGLWSQKKDAANAEKWLGDAVKKNPKDVRTYIGQTTFFLDQGRLNDARTSAKTGLQADPSSVQLRLLDAVVARSAGELDYAERALQELVAKLPSDFGATNQLALVLAEQEDTKKKAQALDIASNNQKLNPNNVEAVTTLGWAMYRNGLPERAEQALQAAVRTGQASSDAAYYLGLIWSDKKKDEAKKLFEAAMAAPGTFVHRKDCEEALKKLTEKKQ
jgi:tetratricopeptide (TPR) repeat protein